MTVKGNKKKWVLYLLPVLLLLLLGALAALRLLHRDDSVAVNDGTGTIWIQPIHGLPTSTFRPEEFSLQDGTVTYTGSQYTVSQGVDVSDWQNEIRWQEVAQSGIDFSVIRCGYRSYGIGELRIDPRFEENYAGAGAAGLRRGVYFFSQATTVEEAREEAAYVLQSLDGRPLELPVFTIGKPSPPRRAGPML